MDISELLSEKVCIDRTKKEADILVSLSVRHIVIFGCGNLGNKIGRFLLSKGYEIAAYSDNNESKWGSELNGVSIISPVSAAEQFGKEALFVVCIWSPERSYKQFKNQLINLGVNNVVHAALIMRLFPAELLPYYHFQLPGYFFEHRDEIKKVYDFLADDESKKQYQAHLDCRINLNFEGLPLADNRNQYFPSGVVELGDSEVFLDAGAYNGDTFEDFCRRTGSKYAKYIALEPDPKNRQDLEKKIKELDAEHVDVYPYAVGKDNCLLKFDATGGGGAGFSDTGTIEVECVRVDDKFYETSPTYLKFDIEGAELDALAGAHKTIEAYKPVLAVCIYHLPDDLWTIPLYIKEKYPFYNIFVRTHQYDGLDFVLYAIPPQA
jgi:FkbM family methyltransferase